MAGKLQNGVDAPPAAGNALAVNNLSGGALTSGDTRRPIVVVLGMHRSGTSLCSHILSMLGVDMADELHANSSNEKGHWERLEIMALQDEILTALDRGYWTPQHDFPLPGAWWAEPNVRAIQARIESLLTKKMKENHLFGFKDPRTARLLPLWLQIFRNLNLVPRFVLCLRAPSQVARSLQKRDGLDPAMGEYRALNYLVDCFRFLPHHDICIVDYEAWFENYSDNLHGLMNFLGIEWDQSEADLGIAVSAVVDRDLRHTEERLGVARQPLVRSFHNLAAALRKDPSRRGEIDRFVDQFVAFQQLLAPFERGQRELGEAAARATDMQARIAELEAALQADSAASQQREQALTEALAAREAELEAVRANLRTAEDRLAEGEARLAALEAVVSAQVAAAEERGSSFSGQLAEREREVESLHDALRESRRREQTLHARIDIAVNGEETAAKDIAALRLEAQGADEASKRLSAELGAVQRCLAEEQSRCAQLERAAITEREEAQKRQAALGISLAARTDEVESARTALRDGKWREQALRTSQENAKQSYEAQIRSLRDQVVDADAALARSTMQKTRSLLTRGLRGSERKLARSGLLDSEWYLSQYEDVSSSGVSPARHYLEEGYLRGYFPNPFFDTRWYLAHNHDVRRSGMNPALHYVQHGAREGRDPGPDFQTEFYLSTNPDVRSAGINPLAHYLRHGRHEGRARTGPR